MFDWVLQNTIVGAALLGVVALSARFLQARPAVLHILWLLVIVRLVLPPLPMPGSADLTGGAALSYWAGGDEMREGTEKLQGRRAAAAEHQETRTKDESPTSRGESTFFFASGTVASGPGPARFLAALRSERFAHWRVLAVSIWLIGALLVLARELRGTWRMQRLVREARPATNEIVARVRVVAREMGVRVPRIRTIPGLRAPFVWSLTRPVLLLDSRGAPPRSVLAHELAHVKRRDHWAVWLEVVALCAHWWNPILHLARARMRRAMELACDAWVVQRYPAERLLYARALVDAAAGGGGVVLPRALGALGPTGRAYEERLVQILHSDVEARVPPLAAIVIALLALPLAADWAGAIETRDVARTDQGIARMLAGFGVESWSELEERSRAELQAAEPGQPLDPVRARARGESFKNLGLALLARSAWEEGARAFRSQIDCGFQPENGRYNLACAHARSGDVEAAFALLHGLLKRGAVDVAGVRQDPDLASLAADPRWSTLVAGGSDPHRSGAGERP